MSPSWTKTLSPISCKTREGAHESAPLLSCAQKRGGHAPRVSTPPLWGTLSCTKVLSSSIFELDSNSNKGEAYQVD